MVLDQRSLKEPTNHPLVLKSRSSEVSLSISPNLLVIAEKVKERIGKSGTVVDIDEELNEVELMLSILQHALEETQTNEISTHTIPFLSTVFSEFCERFLKGNDPHAMVTGLVKSISHEQSLRIFYDVEEFLKKEGISAFRIRNMPALFTDVLEKKARIMAIFGGQGNSEDLLGELLSLYSTYGSLVREFLEPLSAVLLKCAEHEDARDLLGNGLDVMKWIHDVESRPTNDYVISKPVSTPLIGLIQLMNYWVTLKILEWSPAALAAKIAGTTGHSQGIISAVVIASSKTEEDFIENSQHAMKLLFWIGVRGQQICPEIALPPSIVKDSQENGEGRPTAMLAVTKLDLSKLQAEIDLCNEHLPADRSIEVSLMNGSKAFVCAGPPLSLYGLNLRLRKFKADPSEDQSRIPFVHRKAKFTTRFLPVSGLSHYFDHRGIVAKILEDCQRLGISLDPTKIYLPVYHTLTGKQLKEESCLVSSLIKQICAEHVDWNLATGQTDVTHILDFGPGHASGIGALTHHNKIGSGVQIILAGSLSSRNPALQTKQAIFDSDPKSVVYGPDWKAEYSPQLTEANGKIFVDTRFSRLLGKPPLMVAGMTPCTVAEPFCTAIIKAGYHVELAGGGHHNEEVLRAKIDQIIANVGPSCSITLNSLFLNPHLWAFQYPLVKKMRQEGYPIDGFTIAAGVPSFENACEIVESLRVAGIRYVAFKPGSVEAIREVVRIAKACTEMPVVIQWTGGRGGGHHSFEDFHQPILETYSSIRSVSNLYLVAGSGFGDGPDSLPYLTGEWSKAYGVSPMPFDGILLGSRVMVAAESLLHDAVKKLIVKTEGTKHEEDWVRSYNEPVGGVVTVRSELGEPIHKIATRGVLLWKELDETIFQLPKEKRLPTILKQKAYIIERINADYQKVWFGRKMETGKPVDLSEMTYFEVCVRLGELCYVWHQKRWIHESYKKLLQLFMTLIEERFAPGENVLSILSEDWINRDNNPKDLIRPLFNTYPMAKERLLNPEDVQAFLNICALPSHKPVPFIPTLDDDKFEYWFKKDSLWQAEDLDAVIDQDPGRVCILQGPVAVAYNTKANQPVKEILDEINDYYVQALKDAGVPVKHEVWFGGELIAYPAKVAKELATGQVGTKREPIVQFQLPGTDLPTHCQWLEVLAGPSKSWIRALLCSQYISKGPKKMFSNQVRNLLRPRPNFLAEIKYLSDYITPGSLKISEDAKELVLVTYDEEAKSIRLTINYNREGVSLPLELFFKFNPAEPYRLIEEDVSDRNERMKQFYWNIFYGPGREDEYQANKPSDLIDGIFESIMQVDPEKVMKFCRIVGNHAEIYSDGKIAPMDFAIVVCSEALTKPFFVGAFDGNHLNCVHLWNEIEYCAPSSAYINVGDCYTSRAKVIGITLGSSGRTVTIEVNTFNAEGKHVFKVTTALLFLDHFEEDASALQFERIHEDTFVLELRTHTDVTIFMEKSWIRLNEGEFPQIGDSLYFSDLLSFEKRLPDGSHDIEVTGSVGMHGAGMQYHEIGKVCYSGKSLYGNPVTEFLSRAGRTVKEENLFEDNGALVSLSEDSTIITPKTNQPYANCAGDHNPIHTCPLIADYVGLPGTITHGLWTSAAVRSLVEIFAADNNALAVTKFRAEFVDMVLPGESLQARLRHIGMRNGLKLYSVEAFCGERLVLKGRAEVEQPTTAYLFTGQGSQQVGMGMDLYASDPIAKDLWDRADNHFRNNYGFSILEIVRKNPKTMEVHFGGSKGARIRQYYMSLIYETVSLDDNLDLPAKRLFSEITEDCVSYTFTSPAGLLNMTQFTQPAICLVAKSAFEVMRSKGVVCPNAAFAGHSLGEYAALASVGNVLSLETLCDVVFYRGMCMQKAVDRDAEGRSPYRMAAINPTRVQPNFSQDALKFVVDCVQKHLGLLLEIVNYNVQDWQYVVAGHVNAIECLTQTLNHINGMNFDCATLDKDGVIDEVHEKIKATLAKTRESLVIPQRGPASIPITGIDVPFHSSVLLSGVAPFREFLKKSIIPGSVEPSLLEGVYIPNLIGKPFELSRDYIQNIYETCKSPVLKDLLAKDLSAADFKDPIESRVIATKLLIELLAYQFASPVRWIESQYVLFNPPLLTERVIEIGPTPILSGMAERTLKVKFEDMDFAHSRRRVVLSYSKDKAEIYYENNPANDIDPPSGSKSPLKEASPSLVVENTVQPIVQSTPVQTQISERNSKPIELLPIQASEVLQIIICNKMKKSPSQVPLSKSLKELSDGKSTLQNELVADLQKEFGGNVIPDRAEEMPLEELAALLNKASTFAKAPGKHVNGLISKLTSSKFPAGFNASHAKTFLASEFALSSQASDTIFAFALFKEPEARLLSEESAKAWLKEVATDYFKSHGIEFCAPVSGTKSAASVTISTVELDKIQAKHKTLLRQQVELYLAYLDEDQKTGKSANAALAEIVKLQTQLDYWIAEHGGEEYADGIKPLFSILKARRYDSWWNWARQTALELYEQCLNGDSTFIEQETFADEINSLGNKTDQNLVDFLEYLSFNESNAFSLLAIADEERLQFAKHLAAELLNKAKTSLDVKPLFRPFGLVTGPQTIISEQGKIEYKEIPRSESSFVDYVARLKKHDWIYFTSRNESNAWTRDAAQTALYIEALESICCKGLSFEGKTFLMTGCGRASIGGEILKGLLMGGANVILTTSSYCRKNLNYLRTLYEQCGSKGSSLIVVPFNQASKQDVDGLIDYIYGELIWDVDGVIPFGAISEAGKSLMDEVDGRSELAHRLMLTNVMRLLGAVAKAKESRGIVTRPAQVILPLSPNHGNFGNDGLYGESKASLETLLEKWHSEEWNDYLSIVGAIIGWTRGTGLMSDNNLVAEELERLGVYTFSVQEMALNILGLMHPVLVRLADASPVLVDLNGGFVGIKDLHLITRSIRSEIHDKADLLRARHREALEEAKQQQNPSQNENLQRHMVKRRANLNFGFKAGTPKLSLKGHVGLAELLDLGQVVVAVGFGEVGPWGNSRTRWEMESYGQLSLEGCIELAWIMGLIKFQGDGWVDATSGEIVLESQVKSKYEEHILIHSGIRVVEPELLNGYDPNKKRMVQEIVINEDMKPIELSSLEAEQFKLEHGDRVTITSIADSDRCMVKLLKGAVLYIPKALRFDRFVGGLVPTGWNAERYGIPKNIIDQVDNITLFVLVSTVEALVSAGITDPYEFYQYVHLSELGNTSGSGLGGGRSLQKVFRSRFLDEDLPSDIIQESFINTMSAWVNLLLLSSAGPIKTPVGACATAVESIDIGVETILSRKAQVVVVGGFDDFSEEGSFELASMKATSSAEEETAKGREPVEMSRPMASSRSGFMESQGSGIQILMTAKLAIEMGCPIYGIIAAVNTASDKEGRSIPAPGQGILTTAKCIPSSLIPRVLDIEYRLSQLGDAKSTIQAWYEGELAIACSESSNFKDAEDGKAFLSARTYDLRLEADRRLAAEQRQWGQDFGQGDPRISPLTHALARFGLTVDDITVASFHGTATKANDTNESMVLQQQLEHLGRSKGNVCLAICQKYLTGHPKGAAAAWMLNGVLQAINEGLVPGNRNADNIEAELHDMSLIFYPTKPVKCQIRAALLKSFGFGHVGGEVLVLHPDLILGTLSNAAYESYMAKRKAREAKAQAYTYRSLISLNDKLIKLKESPPFAAEVEAQAYLDPTVRAAYDSTAKSWVIGKKQLEASKKAFSAQTAALTKSLYAIANHPHGVGIDVQLINDVPVDNADFLHRNYTKAELEYCCTQPDVHASLAGRWAAKEAIAKALCSSSKDKPEWLQGAGAPLKSIEVLPGISGAPTIRVNGKRLESLKVSISHSGAYAVALAQLY